MSQLPGQGSYQDWVERTVRGPELRTPGGTSPSGRGMSFPTGRYLNDLPLADLLTAGVGLAGTAMDKKKRKQPENYMQYLPMLLNAMQQSGWMQ